MSWSTSAPGCDWDNGLDVMVYVNNLFDENAAAVVRPRTRRPGAARLQRRPAAHVSASRCASVLTADRGCFRRRTARWLLGRSARSSRRGAGGRCREAGRRSARCRSVVGAGVFGAWTAWKLRARGARCLLIDAWGPAQCPRLVGRRIADDARRLRRGRESTRAWRWIRCRSGSGCRRGPACRSSTRPACCSSSRSATPFLDSRWCTGGSACRPRCSIAAR